MAGQGVLGPRGQGLKLDIREAIDNANNPSGTNPFITQNEGIAGSGGNATTLSSTAAGGAGSIDVNDITGYEDGMNIDIELDNGGVHSTTVNGAPSGSTIALTDNLPSQASAGNNVSVPGVADRFLGSSPAATRLQEDISGAPSSFEVRTDLASAFGWWYFAVGVGQSSCEIRKATSISGSTVNVDSAFANTHSANDVVIPLPEKKLKPEWFGAKGDCDPDDPATTPGTDDTTALQNCFSEAGPNGLVELGRFYRTTAANAFDLSSGVKVEGKGWRTGFYHDQASNTNGYLFRVWKDVANVTLRNFFVHGFHDGTTGGSPSVSGKVVMIGNDDPDGTYPASLTESPHDVLVENLLVREGMEAVWCGQFEVSGEDFGSYGPWNITLRNIHAYDCEHAVNLRGTRGNISLSNLKAINDAKYTQRGVLLSGCTGGVDIDTVTGKDIGVTLLHVAGDSSSGKDLRDINIANVYADNCNSLTIKGDGSGSTRKSYNISLSNIKLKDTNLTLTAAALGLLQNVKLKNIDIVGGVIEVTNVKRLDLSNVDVESPSGAASPVVELDGCETVRWDKGTIFDTDRGSGIIAIKNACQDVRLAKMYFDSGASASTAAIQISGTGTHQNVTINESTFVVDISSGTAYGIEVFGCEIDNLRGKNNDFSAVDIALRDRATAGILGDFDDSNVWPSGNNRFNSGVFVGNFGGRALTSGELAAGTTAGKAKSTQDLHYQVKNEMFYKAATDDLFDCTGFTDLTAGQYAKVLYVLTNAGTATAIEGTAANSLSDAKFGDVPSTGIIVGWLEIGDGSNPHDWDVDALTDHGGTFYDGVPDSL